MLRLMWFSDSTEVTWEGRIRLLPRTLDLEREQAWCAPYRGSLERGGSTASSSVPFHQLQPRLHSDNTEIQFSLNSENIKTEIAQRDRLQLLH